MSWTESNAQISKTTEGIAGKQAFRLVAESDLGYVLQQYTVVADENYFLSLMYKCISGDTTKFILWDDTNSATIFDSGTKSDTSWTLFESSFMVPKSCTTIELRIYGISDTDVIYFSSVVLENQLGKNMSFEITGTELVTNGTFDADTDWNKSGTTIAAGVMSFAAVASGNTGNNQSNVLTVNNDYYFLSFDILNRSAGGIRTLNSFADDVTFSTDDTHTLTSKAVSTTLTLRTSGTTTLDVDNVSVKEIEGWLTTNATLDLDSSNEKSGTYCAKITSTAANGYVYQAITVTDLTYYTAVFHGKATAGDSYKYQVVGSTTGKVYFDSDTETGASYKEVRCQFKTTGDTEVQLRGICVGNDDIIYFDDWAMVPLIPITMDYTRVYSGTTVVAAESGFFGDYSDTLEYEVTQGNCKIFFTSVVGSSGDITINYTLEDDREGLASIKPYYSFSPSGNLNTMTSAGGDDGVNSLTTSASGTAHDFIWSTVSDLGSDFRGKIYITFNAYDRINYIGDYNSSETLSQSINNAPLAPTIDAPTYGFDKEETPQFVGTIPDPNVVASDMHIAIEIATDSGFSDIFKIYESRNDQAGWEYYDGSAYVEIPSTGIPTNSDMTLVGNNWRFTIQTEDRLPTGQLYVRCRFFGLNN